MRFAFMFSTAAAGGLLLSLLVTTGSALTGKECPKRNVTAAREVGRVRCHRPCSGPEDTSCKNNKLCLCAHECGYSCINMENYCGEPPIVPNSKYYKIERPGPSGTRLPVLHPPYQFDDIAVYVCKPGFEITTKRMPKCHGRKKWTVGLTQCLRSCEIKNTAKVRALNLICGQSCTIDDDCTDNKTCLCDGSCGRSCVNPDVDCGFAPPANNATIEYTGEKFRRVAHYICDDGFYLQSGSVARQCTGGGTYDGVLAQCKRVVCGDPLPAIEATGGEIMNYRSGPYYVGHEFHFRCPPSFRMLGNKVRTCLSNGRWSGIPTVCDSVDDIDERCPHPGVPVNGFLMNVNSFGFGQVVQFGCDVGFAMVGEAEQECLFYKQWSGNGAPRCVDPRYSDRTTDVVAKLQRRTASIKSRLRPRSQIGRHISAGHKSGHEIYFIVDVSKSVITNEPELNSSLTFCIKLIDRLSANATGTIRYGLLLFASKVKVLVNPNEEFITAAGLKEKIYNIVPDKNKHTKDLGGATATYKVLQELQVILALSYDQSRRNNTEEMERHLFFVTDGRHTEGPSPIPLIQDIILQFNASANQGIGVLEFYSVTSCKECQSAHTDAYKELLGLANGKRENFIRINDFYSINNLLDTVTDAKIDYSVCGKAGDTSSIRQRARVQLGRVISGSRAPAQSWTWQVLISLYGNDLGISYGSANVKGGGSLINNKWVLTAAHVVKPYLNSIEGILLTFGMFSRPTRDTKLLPPAVKVYTASKIFFPKKYALFHFDVALIRLKSELEFKDDSWVPTGVSGTIKLTDQIRPVCLPCIPGNCVGELLKKGGLLTGNETNEERCEIEGDWLVEKDKVDKRILAVVTGFGHVDPREHGGVPPVPSPVLKQGLIRIRTDQHCNDSARILPWGGFKIPYTSAMSCATSGEQNKIVDSCQGDSGGPVVREVFDDETKESCWVQIGIVSWGWGCGQMLQQGGKLVQVPGYHTRVSAVMSWVNETISTEE